jgi:Protein of unknown function (DUF2911)
MACRVRRVLALACSLWLLAGAPEPAGGQPPPADAAQPARHGAIRAELSLGNGRSATVVAAPAAASAASVGVLELDGPIRLGDLALGQAAGESRYVLRLEQRETGWQLQVDSAASGASVGVIALSIRDSLPLAPSRSVALVPTVKDGARLSLRWDSREASVDLRFLRPLVVRRSLNNGRANEPVSRAHFAKVDPRQLRTMLLTQSNLAGLSFGGGKSMALWYPRLDADGPDAAALATAVEGQVIELTQSSAPRFKFDVPMRFNGQSLPAENLAPGFQGSYSLWLKRARNGWRLVFNHQPDVWGSQHDAEADALEVDLQHSQDADPSRPFGAALVAASPDEGRLVLQWGPHTWTAAFDLGN